MNASWCTNGRAEQGLRVGREYDGAVSHPGRRALESRLPNPVNFHPSGDRKALAKCKQLNFFREKDPSSEEKNIEMTSQFKNTWYVSVRPGIRPGVL